VPTGNGRSAESGLTFDAQLDGVVFDRLALADLDEVFTGQVAFPDDAGASAEAEE